MMLETARDCKETFETNKQYTIVQVSNKMERRISNKIIKVLQRIRICRQY